MGAAASTGNEFRKITLQEENLVDPSKPVDASDVQSLDQALEEIRLLRRLARKYFEARNPRDTIKVKGERQAVVQIESGGSMNYEDIEFTDKSEAASETILNAIKTNTLFRRCKKEEFQKIVHAFRPVVKAPGENFIEQGKAGSTFFVIEEGETEIWIKQASSPEPIKVGLVRAGGSFGELALMYNTPRAATIKASTAPGCGFCKCWEIERAAFKAIIKHFHQARMEKYVAFLRKVTIGDTSLDDCLTASELQQLAGALDLENFDDGSVIIRQGEVGDFFYIIEYGEVVVTKETDGNSEELATLGAGSFFGERALLSDDKRQATCTAKGAVRLLYLNREDFSRMLGSFSELMSGDKSAAKAAREKQSSAQQTHDHFIDMELTDLDTLRVLGCGAFGVVKMVKHKTTGETYALKCQSKAAIVENNLAEHVLNERTIMMQLDCPQILQLHNSFQDDRYIYFVLELLLGGELFTHLRNSGSFPEHWARFYAASVVSTFNVMHAKRIAYRDLKPENLVLDDKGFCKLVDFGLAKIVTSGRTWTLCGTPDYLAPEIILNEGHDLSVDYWALGVLIYEMVSGLPPFYAEDPMEVYEKILSVHYTIPPTFSKMLADIIRKLLKQQQSKRLGNTRGGTHAVVKHKWFSGFDWQGLRNRTLDCPIKPTVTSREDGQMFEEMPEQPLAPVCTDWNPDLSVSK
uniref:cGMP-dependent protein kinase n=1 Tax=Phaeomonas parva TaxID=124430 RepID=A0A7S1U5U3_9STRA|mmetsp:Transcript_30318/g.96752  ORF Transcript_30318/g.96752 Transcript_30318/m.96752 type:complete len:692 (+) Transcript_30318:292-2367(+)